MNTDSKIHEALSMLGAAAKTTIVDVVVAKALDELAAMQRVEQEHAEKIRKLEEMLRLANDKCAERVRQARWEVADEALGKHVLHDMEAFLFKVRETNAPKD